MTTVTLLAASLLLFSPQTTLAQSEPRATTPEQRAPSPEQRASSPEPRVTSPEPRVEPPVVDIQTPARGWQRDIVRFGNNFVLTADDGASDVTVIGGDTTIEGRVGGDVVVVLGRATIGATALIDGSLVVVGGATSVADGARLRRDLVVVGGRLDAPATFVPGGDYIVVGPQAFGERFAGFFEWLMRGAIWGRIIVPSLWWVWAVALVFFAAYLLLGVLFEKPVRDVADTLEARPFTTLVVGFLVTLILGPMCLLLAVSVVGIAVIPLVLVALCAAWVLGKIGTMRWIGRGLAGRAESPRVDAVRSFAIGAAVVTLAYMVPVVGLATWTLLSVFAVGGSTLAFLAAYRRESPVFPRAPRFAAVPVATASAVASAPFTPFTASVDERQVVGDDEAMPPISVPPAGSLLSFPKAAFRDRLAAGALDIVLLLLLVGFFDPWFDNNRWFVLALGYFIGFWSWKGTTIGGIICQLRVVRVDNQPMRFVDGLVRGLSSIFSLIVVGLGFLWILKDPDRQAWHDRIAGTYVVKVPRNWPL